MKISKHHSPLPTLTACFGLIGWSLAADSLDRTILPIPQPKRPVITETDARNAKAPERFHVTAPQGAPNVVIILLDDLGFGATSTFEVSWISGPPTSRIHVHEAQATSALYSRIQIPSRRVAPSREASS